MNQKMLRLASEIVTREMMRVAADGREYQVGDIVFAKGAISTQVFKVLDMKGDNIALAENSGGVKDTVRILGFAKESQIRDMINSQQELADGLAPGRPGSTLPSAERVRKYALLSVRTLKNWLRNI